MYTRNQTVVETILHFYVFRMVRAQYCKSTELINCY